MGVTLCRLQTLPQAPLSGGSGDYGVMSAILVGSTIFWNLIRRWYSLVLSLRCLCYPRSFASKFFDDPEHPADRWQHVHFYQGSFLELF